MPRNFSDHNCKGRGTAGRAEKHDAPAAIWGAETLARLALRLLSICLAAQKRPTDRHRGSSAGGTLAVPDAPKRALSRSDPDPRPGHAVLVKRDFYNAELQPRRPTYFIIYDKHIINFKVASIR